MPLSTSQRLALAAGATAWTAAFAGLWFLLGPIAGSTLAVVAALVVAARLARRPEGGWRGRLALLAFLADIVLVPWFRSGPLRWYGRALVILLFWAGVLLAGRSAPAVAAAPAPDADLPPL